MTFHFGGQFNGDKASLPERERPVGASEFEIPDTPAKQKLKLALASFIVMLYLFSALIARGGLGALSIWGALLAVAFIPPHLALHAVFYREDVWVYWSLKEWKVLLLGTEDMGRGKLVLMTLLPAMLFGILPVAVYMIHPKLPVLGTLGALTICFSIRDFYIAYKALKTMPVRAKAYTSGLKAYWYVPPRESLKSKLSSLKAGIAGKKNAPCDGPVVEATAAEADIITPEAETAEAEEKIPEAETAEAEEATEEELTPTDGAEENKAEPAAESEESVDEPDGAAACTDTDPGEDGGDDSSAADVEIKNE